MHKKQGRRGFLKGLVAAPAIIATGTVYARAADDGGVETWTTTHRTKPSPQFQAFTDAVSAAVLHQAIEVRTAYGYSSLRPETELYNAAQTHTEDMYNRKFFDHITPEGIGPRERVAEYNDAPYRKLGENLWRTWGVHEWNVHTTAQTVIQGWLDSPGHKRVLLDPDFSTGGVAARGDADELFVTMLYAKPS